MSQRLNLSTTLRFVYLLSLVLLAWFVAPSLPDPRLSAADRHDHDHHAVAGVEAERAPTGVYGPYVGGVTHESAVVWVRTDDASEVFVTYSTDPELSGGVTSQSIIVLPEADNTVHIPLPGLEALTTYYFNVNDGGPIYHFTTFPDPSQVVDFNFVVFSDSSSAKDKAAPAYETAVTLADPAFVLQIGDFRHTDPVRYKPVVLDNWRINNRYALRDTDSGAQFADYIGGRATGLAIPFIHIWDDHDFGKDNANRHMPAQWKQWAKQAFLEYFPAYPLPNPDNGLWHSFRYAQAEFFILDLRYQRDDGLDPDGPDKSILNGAGLGPTGQKQWLKDGLLASTAEWKFLISPSVFNPTSKPKDSWFNFQTEQQELVNFINDNHITGVIIISGDIHSAGGIDDGANAFFPELTVPHTNLGDVDCTGGEGCGTWSVGIIQPTPLLGGGYALVTVDADGFVTLSARGGDFGYNRLEYTLNREW